MRAAPSTASPTAGSRCPKHNTYLHCTWTRRRVCAVSSAAARPSTVPVRGHVSMPKNLGRNVMCTGGAGSRLGLDDGDPVSAGQREAQSPNHLVQNCALGSRQGCQAKTCSGCEVRPPEGGCLTTLGGAPASPHAFPRWVPHSAPGPPVGSRSLVRSPLREHTTTPCTIREPLHRRATLPRSSWCNLHGLDDRPATTRMPQRRPDAGPACGGTPTLLEVNPSRKTGHGVTPSSG